MKRFIIAVLVFAGIGIAVGQAARKLSGVNCGTLLDKMPDDAPLKWMFRNITEIHDNTERIIELLETRSSHETSAETVSSSV